MVAFGLVLTLALPMRGSRWIRAAIALPFVQALALLCAWGLWISGDNGELPLAQRVPTAVVVAAIVLAYAAVSARVARGSERLHAGVMLALANLLAVGLWLPIATRVWCGAHPGQTDLEYAAVDDHLAALGVMLLVPPFAAACAFVALRFRHRRLPRVRWLLVIVFAAAIASSTGRSPIHDYAFGQFITSGSRSRWSRSVRSARSRSR